MTANRFAIAGFGALLALGAAPATACVPEEPASDAVVAERVRSRQTELWSRSDAVFLSQSGALEAVSLSHESLPGRRTTLAPSLALKGNLPEERIDIRHTTMTNCGPIPFLEALTGREGEWFVTYGRYANSGLSIDATVPVADLIDAEALRAWRKAAGSGADDAASAD